MPTIPRDRLEQVELFIIRNIRSVILENSSSIIEVVGIIVSKQRFVIPMVFNIGTIGIYINTVLVLIDGIRISRERIIINVRRSVRIVIVIIWIVRGIVVVRIDIRIVAVVIEIVVIWFAILIEIVLSVVIIVVVIVSRAILILIRILIVRILVIVGHPSVGGIEVLSFKPVASYVAELIVFWLDFVGRIELVIAGVLIVSGIGFAVSFAK